MPGPTNASLSCDEDGVFKTVVPFEWLGNLAVYSHAQELALRARNVATGSYNSLLGLRN